MNVAFRDGISDLIDIVWQGVVTVLLHPHNVRKSHLLKSSTQSFKLPPSLFNIIYFSMYLFELMICFVWYALFHLYGKSPNCEERRARDKSKSSCIDQAGFERAIVCTAS